MEGVGARLGRSSTRYGPATVFNGPVRKWKKKWVHVTPPAAAANAAANNHSSHAANGTSNGNNGSRLFLYKWTPLSQSSNGLGSGGGGDRISPAAEADGAAEPAEEPPRRRFKYVPVAVLEEQKNEASEKIDDDDTKPNINDPTEEEQISKSNNYDEKPDINDVPMEDGEAPDDVQQARQDLNESTLDLSLGLKAHDDEHDPETKADQTKDGELNRVS